MTDTTTIAWLGLDAHSRNCVLAQLDDHGSELNCWRFPTHPQQLLKHVQAVPATVKRLMLEESNLARWIAQLLKPQVQHLVVCDARRNRLISQDSHKHDRRDAFALARPSCAWANSNPSGNPPTISASSSSAPPKPMKMPSCARPASNSRSSPSSNIGDSSPPAPPSFPNPAAPAGCSSCLTMPCVPRPCFSMSS